MDFKLRKVLLKNDIPCLLRSPHPQDAALLISHMKMTASESDYISMYPDEVKLSIPQEQHYLHKGLLSRKSLMISAFIDNSLVANASIYPVSNYERYYHRANFGISVRKKYWSQGIGSHLISELIQCSPKMNYEQLELEVVCENKRGRTLYEKFGFQICGKRERSFKYRDGSYADMYLMIRKL